MYVLFALLYLIPVHASVLTSVVRHIQQRRGGISFWADDKSK